MAEQETTPPHPAQRIGVREFRGNFSRFMRQVRHGASFIVTSRDEAVAMIGPPQSTARPRRQPGTLRGKIHMTPDFDTLPAEILAAMEGNEG
jgi:antitoxin (DNA-binding transcriptional repressor) of toxin-antitoxin stability system